MSGLRWQASAIRQERRVGIDERLLKREGQLTERERKAMQAYRPHHEKLPKAFPVAAQFQLEHSYEDEFDAIGFDLAGFMDDAWRWSKSLREFLEQRIPGSSL